MQLVNVNECGECDYRTNARSDLEEHIYNTHKTKMKIVGRKGNLKVKCGGVTEVSEKAKYSVEKSLIAYRSM